MFNFGGDDLTFDALIDGDGEITVANGTVIYQGDASGFTGTTEITGGTLELDEATLGGTISVSGWGTLSGTGTLGSTTIESGATVTPGGDDVGTLTIDGDSSSRRGNLRGRRRHRLQCQRSHYATGTATLNGGSVLHVGPSSGYAANQSYVILSADGGLTGEFDTVSSDYSFLDASLAYDANDVTADARPQFDRFRRCCESGNQSATLMRSKILARATRSMMLSSSSTMTALPMPSSSFRVRSMARA